MRLVLVQVVADLRGHGAEVDLLRVISEPLERLERVLLAPLDRLACYILLVDIVLNNRIQIVQLESTSDPRHSIVVYLHAINLTCGQLNKQSQSRT